MGQALRENDVLVFDDSNGVADSRGERGLTQEQFEGGEARHIHLLLDILFLCHVAGNAIMLLCDFRESAVIHVGVHLQEKQFSVNHATTLKERFNRLLHLLFGALRMRICKR